MTKNQINHCSSDFNNDPDLFRCIAGDQFIPWSSDYLKYDSEKDQWQIHVKLKNEIPACPSCHQISKDNRGWYILKRQTFPLDEKTTVLYIHVHRWKCHNPDCTGHKTFYPKMKSIPRYRRRTADLDKHIFAAAVHMSAHAAQEVCDEFSINISDSTILRLYRYVCLNTDQCVPFIGIDDIAVRKGQTYDTVIYNGLNHSLIDLLPGRDGVALRKYLKAHPEINMVCRDRASAYSSAIQDVFGDSCLQIADRYHLFENILSYLKQDIKSFFPHKVMFRGDVLLEEKPKREWLPAVAIKQSKAAKIHYDNSAPLDSSGKEIIVCSTNRRTQGTKGRAIAKRRLKKWKMVKSIREEWYGTPPAERPTKKKLTEKYGIDKHSLRKYLAMSDSEADQIKDQRLNKRPPKEMDNYTNIVFKMLTDGYEPQFIEGYIMALGFPGTRPMIERAISNIAYNHFGKVFGLKKYLQYRYPDGVWVVTQTEILRRITCVDPKKKAVMERELPEEKIEILYKYFPRLKKDKEVWDDYHEAIMGGDPEKLTQFLDKYAHEQILLPLIKSLKKDITPVTNAISHKENSGFVEGNNCTMKLNKRVMYGRCKLPLLFTKSKVLSSINHENKRAIDQIHIPNN